MMRAAQMPTSSAQPPRPDVDLPAPVSISTSNSNTTNTSSSQQYPGRNVFAISSSTPDEPPPAYKWEELPPSYDEVVLQSMDNPSFVPDQTTTTTDAVVLTIPELSDSTPSTQQ